MCKEKTSCTCTCGGKKQIQENKKQVEKVVMSAEQKELLKKHRSIQESLLSMYSLCSDKGIYNEKLFNFLDESYKNIDLSILLLLTEQIKRK